MKKKKVISALLAAVLISNSGLVGIGPVTAAGSVNLARGKTVAVSSEESENPKANAVDGDHSTRWATPQNKGANEYIEINLDGAKPVQQIQIYFEKSDAEQNILEYQVELEENGAYKVVHTKSEKAKQEEIIQLDSVHMATKVKVKILNVKQEGWVNVGINEIEVYSEKIENADATENKNHMLNATMTASSSETNQLTPDKVKDGNTDRASRWSSVYENPTTNIWLNAAFAKLTSVKEIQIQLLDRDVAPMPSNVKSFDIKYKDKNGEEKLLQTYTNTASGEGYKKDLVIRLDQPIEAKSLKLCNFVTKECEYNNVGIIEMRVFSNDQVAAGASLEDVVAQITGGEVTADAAAFTLPTVPEGFQIESNGADFEQLVGAAKEDGTIPVIHPLTDKTVKVSFNVTEEKTGKTKNTGDLDFVVKGRQTQADGKNAKPVVIPEIQEWYSDSTEKAAVESLTAVTYDNAALKTVVDEFVKDYEDFTGIKLTPEQGGAKANAFNFSMQAPDALLGEEGYTMDIQADRINVASESTTGNMFGMQTILQMYKENTTEYPVGQMRDYPRYQTRGLLLDVARKPVSLEMMKEFTRTMRYYKMNDFQAHLSDNYIWLEDYGYLTTEKEAFKAYEAFRLESSLKNKDGLSPTAEDYSISKADFKKFILDERAVGMNIVPEIDVPAHATSFTKVWPELMVTNGTGLTAGRPLIDHFDIRKPEAVKKIKEIFDDYTKDANKTFDSETVVHIGADEFVSGATAYRKFVNEIVPYVKKTNPVRMWGGLTWIKDGQTEIQESAIKDVEMNLWSSDWADGIEMYNMGYKLINTIDNYGYMVPNGNLGRANAYGDLLNVSRVFSSFKPNSVRVKNGAYKEIPSGDDQMLGAAFAIWSDNIDKKASGLTESDLYWRFFDAMPFYAEKTWAATGQEKGSAETLAALAQKKGTGPNTNPYYQEEKIGSSYAEYTFNGNLKDSSQNQRNLTAGENAEVKDGALQLKEGKSYVTSPLEQLGNGNALSFDITLENEAKPGEILFEEDAPYGTHDIRIMEDGNLGFTRELYEYKFDYKIPAGKKVNLRIAVTQQKAELFVNGEFVSAATGRFFHNDMVKKDRITNATFALPLERIGSKTKAIAAKIDNVRITSADMYNKAAWTGQTNSETPNLGSEGQLWQAFDNNAGTRWHSDWKGTTGTVETVNGTPGTLEEIWAEITFDQPYEINQFSFTPRTDTPSGYVTKASLMVKNTADGQWKEIATNQEFENNGKRKVFDFELQEVAAVKFIAKQSSDGWVAVSEFDIARTGEPGETPEQPEPPKETAETVLEKVKEQNGIPNTIEKDVKQFVLPEVPDGYTIAITAANPEGIVSLEDASITTPKEDTEVTLTITVTGADGDTASGDFVVTFKGSGETPDPENPDPEKPDPENPDPENPDPENPNPDKPNPDQPGGDSNGGNKPDGNKPSGNTSTTNKPVKTGDSFQMTWIVLGIISGTVIVALRKKRKRNV